MPSGKKKEPTEFTKFIASYLTEKKTMPTAELARITGISRPHLVKMLQGGKYWDVDQLEAVCHALNEDIVNVIKLAEEHVHQASNVTPFPDTSLIDPESFDPEATENRHFLRAAKKKTHYEEPDSI
jgi:DNA-binding Xre family transcriptional regulator